MFNFTIKAMYVASHDMVCNEKSPLGNDCRIQEINETFTMTSILANDSQQLQNKDLMAA